MNKKLIAAGLGVVGLIGASLSDIKDNPTSQVDLKASVLAINPSSEVVEIQEIVEPVKNIEEPVNETFVNEPISNEEPPIENVEIEIPPEVLPVTEVFRAAEIEIPAETVEVIEAPISEPTVSVQTVLPVVSVEPETITPEVRVEENQTANCDPNYLGCIPLGIFDADCASGSGNGPYYVDYRVQVFGDDPHDLDRDGNGWGCENE